MDEPHFDTSVWAMVDRLFEAQHEHTRLRIILHDEVAIGNCYVVGIQDYDNLGVTFANAPHGMRGMMFVQTTVDKIATIEVEE